jgi:hypothetical protein
MRLTSLCGIGGAGMMRSVAVFKSTTPLGVYT